jgi:outer membrane lipoprotein-sorting protein
MKRFLIILFVSFIFILPGRAFSLGADEIIEKANLAYYYGGEDGRAYARMTIKDRAGRTRIRVLTMLRKDLEEGGRQKFYVYFHEPADVSGMVFMVWKNPGKDDDRWLYIPAIDLVKRVAASDKRSSFAGSHFTYEDVSGRDPADDTHELLREEPFEGKDAYVIKNTPKDGSLVEFSHYITWIDKENFLPLKGEYFDKGGKLYKVMTTEEVKKIQGIPTVVKARTEDIGSGETVVEFVEVRYSLGIKEGIFKERYLRKPPRKFIK